MGECHVARLGHIDQPAATSEQRVRIRCLRDEGDVLLGDVKLYLRTTRDAASVDHDTHLPHCEE